jgi:hypothetical protein
VTVPFDSYDPDVPPSPPEWLALDEAVRLELVMAHHANAGTRLPNVRLHAAIHVVVENQVALRDPAAVGETLTRLQHEGLSRHDAIHAVGATVTELLLDLSNAPTADRAATIQRYVDRLAHITDQCP